MMVDAAVPFDSYSKVVLNCGNIASWNKIKKKVLLTSTQELSSSVENTLVSTSGITTHCPSTNVTDDTYILRNSGLYQTIKDDERGNLNITLKIFLSSWTGNDVSEAIYTSLAEMGVNSVETVILSFPPCPAEELTLEKIKPVWKAFEKVADKGLMKFLGTSDLSARILRPLFEWAMVKPRINQMNLAHCCTIPEDLVEYSKEVNIRLMTHNDEKSILPTEELQKILASTLMKKSNMTSSWQNSWVTRYHAIVHMRGIVSHKGYIMKLACN